MISHRVVPARRLMAPSFFSILLSHVFSGGNTQLSFALVLGSRVSAVLEKGHEAKKD
jgi:hypothetical protein